MITLYHKKNVAVDVGFMVWDKFGITVLKLVCHCPEPLNISQIIVLGKTD